MKRLLYITFLLLSVFTSRASHIVGLDLNYKWVSGNTYQITLIAYGDCGPAATSAFSTLPTASPQICIYDGDTYITSVSLSVQAPSAGVEITPVCTAYLDSTQCTSTSYTTPGIKKFVYTGNYTLPHNSTLWRFLFVGDMGGASGTGRSAAITNIVSGTTSQLVDTLNNTIGHNSNPTLSVIPTPFFCINNNDNYNPGAIDPDGDSLSFFLVPGMGNGLVSGAACSPSGPVTYLGGLSGSHPLLASSFSFSQNSGQISFLPNATQRSLVVYNMEEWRDGHLIGTSQREMTFLVLTCTTPPPTGAITGISTGTVVDSTHCSVCVNSGSFSLNITPTEEDTSNNITVTATGLPTGATISITGNNTPHPYITLNWNSTGVAPGIYNFYINYSGSSCPLSNQQTNAYSITIANPPIISGITSFCVGDSITLNAVPSGGTWALSNSKVATINSTTGTAYGLLPGTDTVTYTSPAGCKASGILTVNAFPGSLLGNNNVCLGGTTTLTSSTGIGTWSSSSTVNAIVGTTSGIVSGISLGSAIITFITPQGCVATMPITISTISPILGNSVLCPGNTGTLYDSLTGGIWSYTSSSIATLNTTTGIIAAVTSGTLPVTYTLSSGCYATAIVTVGVVPDAITGTTVFCTGVTKIFTDAPVGGFWTSANTVIANINTVNGWVTGLNVGSTIITYTLPDGCFTTIPVTVTPVPPIMGAGIICPGKTLTLSDSLGPGNWVTNSPAIASVGYTTGVIYGIYGGTVAISYTSLSGCIATTTVSIFPIPPPITGPQFICLGNVGLLSNSNPFGTWASSDTTVATIGTTTGLVSGLSSGTSVISYTLSTGCSATAEITVNNMPAVSGTPVMCAGDFTNLSNSAPGGSWSSNNPSIATVTTIGTVHGIAYGTTEIYYTIDSGCAASILVTVNPNPAPISGTLQICNTANTTLSDLTTSGSWLSENNQIASINASTGLLTGINAGSTNISYILPTGCLTTTIITINPNPTPVIGNPVICQSSEIYYSVTYPTGGTWTLSNNNKAQFVTAAGLVLGNNLGIDTLTYTTTHGCSTSIIITVSPTPPLATGQDTICVNNSVTLSDALLGGYWSCFNISVAVIDSFTGVVTGINAGTVAITYTTPEGCSEQTFFTVIPKPELSFSLPTFACVGQEVQLSVTNQGSFNQYYWNLGNATVVGNISDSLGTFNLLWDTGGTYIVQLKGIGDAVCPLTQAQDTINIYSLPNASIMPPVYLNSKNGQLCLGDSILLRTTMPVQGDFYFWQPINFFEVNNKSMVYGQITSPGYVTLTINDPYGCSAIDSIYLNPQACCQIVVPTAFSPNGDGLNDIFRPVMNKTQPVETFIIANRWGQIVYEADFTQFGWDGTFKGIPQEPDTYYYLLIYDCYGQTMTQKGDITLIR